LEVHLHSQGDRGALGVHFIHREIGELWEVHFIHREIREPWEVDSLGNNAARIRGQWSVGNYRFVNPARVLLASAK
jgi:hypothetical protein